MPAVPALITAGTTIGSTLLAGRSQNKAAERAANASAEGLDKSLAWEREQDALDRAAYDQAQAENRRRYDIESDRDERRWSLDQQQAAWKNQNDVSSYNAEQRRRQPYRDTSLAAVQALAKQAGLTITPTQAAQLAGPPAAGQAQYMADLLAQKERA